MEIHAPSIAILAVSAVVFLSYLFLCGRCEDLGRRITDLEKRKETLRGRHTSEVTNWERELKIDSMRALLAKHGLDMDWPDDQHTFKVPWSVLERLSQRTVVDRVEVALGPDEEAHDE